MKRSSYLKIIALWGMTITTIQAKQITFTNTSQEFPAQLHFQIAMEYIDLFENLNPGEPRTIQLAENVSGVSARINNETSDVWNVLNDGDHYNITYDPNAEAPENIVDIVPAPVGELQVHFEMAPVGGGGEEPQGQAQGGGEEGQGK